MLHSQVPLGILPGGTANVLATEIKLARGWSAPPSGWRNAGRTASRWGA